MHPLSSSPPFPFPPAFLWGMQIDYDVLTHDRQRHITCIAWRPISRACLAVGCRDGLFLWHTESSPATVERLCGGAVYTMSWSPDGSFLATGSPGSDCITVWVHPHVTSNQIKYKKINSAPPNIF